MNLDWSPELESEQVEESWLGFKSKFLATLNAMAPMRTIRVEARSEPWMNLDILVKFIPKPMSLRFIPHKPQRQKTFSEKQKCKSF